MNVSHELTEEPASWPVSVRLLSLSASLPAASLFNRESEHGQ